MVIDYIEKAKELAKEGMRKEYYDSQYHEATISFRIGISTGR